MPEPMSPQPTTPTLFIDPPPYPSPRRGRGTPAHDRLRAIIPLGLALDDHGDALAAADAGGGETVSPLPPPKLEGKGQEQARARGPQRMAEGDRSPVHVGLLAVEAQLLLDRQVLARERFVHLREVEVLRRQARRLQ